MAIGPCQRQSGNKIGTAVDIRTLFGKQAFNLAHRHIPVAAWRAFEVLPLGPVGGVNARTAIERIDAETTPFRKWVFRVAKIVLLELLRDGRRRRQVNLGSETKRAVFEQVMDPATAISARIERDDTLARFLESVSSLPEPDRKLVSYCGLEGLSYKVAAQRLDSTEGAVARRWQRLRKRLAEGGIPRDLFDPSLRD